MIDLWARGQAEHALAEIRKLQAEIEELKVEIVKLKQRTAGLSRIG